MALGYDCRAASRFARSKVLCTASKGRSWHTGPSLSGPPGYGWLKGLEGMLLICEFAKCVALGRGKISRRLKPKPTASLFRALFLPAVNDSLGHSLQMPMTSLTVTFSSDVCLENAL